jgi:preprotein translocase subunit YajC
VTVAAIVAGLIAVGNVILVALDADVAGKQSVAGALVFAAIMAVAAVFMWRRAYWAVLGFQFLLGLSVVTASLSLLVASNAEAVIRSVVIIVAAGALFWFLIRAMARLQMPTRTR